MTARVQAPAYGERVQHCNSRTDYELVAHGYDPRHCGECEIIAGIASGDPAPVHTLDDMRAGAAMDRPVYVLDTVGVWEPFTAPAGPHQGHTLVIRKVRPTVLGPGRLAVAQCIPCRARWTFTEADNPREDVHRYRPR